jgi:3-oxoacyl-(acyl-carrier-protein) synthase
MRILGISSVQSLKNEWRGPCASPRLEIAEPILAGGVQMLNIRNFAILGALVLMAGTASAQQPPSGPPPAEPAQPTLAQPAEKAKDAAVQTMRGELTKVDVDAKMISIKSADGTETQFTYTDDTEVTGAQKNVAGLATQTGWRVTVTYITTGTTKAATKIEVQAKGKE